MYDTVSKSIVRKHADAIHVGDRIPRQPELEDYLREDLQKAETFLDEKLGATKDELSARDNAFGQSPVQMLISRAVAEAGDADVVFHGALTENSLAQGDIRMKDVWRIVPYENRIAVMKLTPAEILEILEENSSRRNSIHFLGVHGLGYTWRKDEGGDQRIERLRLPDGTTPHPRKRIRVAVNSYVLASGGGRFPRLRGIAERPESRLAFADLDVRAAVIRYVRRHNPLTVERLMKGVPSE